MAEQEEQTVTVLDVPVPGRSRTGRAVALARLLHHECTQLLQLYVSLPVIATLVMLNMSLVRRRGSTAQHSPAPLVMLGLYCEHEAGS